MPLCNVLALCGDIHPILVAIYDCSEHMASGGKKDAAYIAELFGEKVVEYDPEKVHTDLFFFDGAGNMQKGGAILTAQYPRAYCFHGGEHVVSLFFSDISKLTPIKVSAKCGDNCYFTRNLTQRSLSTLQRLLLKTCRLYNVFGSGANHGIYAQFMAQSANANSGRTVGLLRGAGTRFASWFYAMIRLVRMKNPLLATIHQEKFRELDLNERARQAILDIQDRVFWRALYAILRATFPAIRVLRYCDSTSEEEKCPIFSEMSHKYTTKCPINESHAP